nr:E3 ubiquitin-protein ligase sina-like [Rhipicephalus microplus]
MKKKRLLVSNGRAFDELLLALKNFVSWTTLRGPEVKNPSRNLLHCENVVVTATNFRRVEAFCWVALQTCLGRDFVVMLRKRNNRVSRNHFFGAVLLIGLSEEALRFLYRFELRGAEHRLSWSARTRNLHSQTETDRSGGGLVLDMSTAERLCNGADLIMDVTVSVAPSLSGDNVL